MNTSTLSLAARRAARRARKLARLADGDAALRAAVGNKDWRQVYRLILGGACTGMAAMAAITQAPRHLGAYSWYCWHEWTVFVTVQGRTRAEVANYAELPVRILSAAEAEARWRERKAERCTAERRRREDKAEIVARLQWGLPVIWEDGQKGGRLLTPNRERSCSLEAAAMVVEDADHRMALEASGARLVNAKAEAARVKASAKALTEARLEAQLDRALYGARF